MSQPKVNKKQKKLSSTVKERNLIQLQSGATKAYTKRNPLSKKLQPLNDGKPVPTPRGSSSKRFSKGSVDNNVMTKTSMRFQHSVQIQESSPPSIRISEGSPSMLDANPNRGPGPLRRMASEGNYNITGKSAVDLTKRPRVQSSKPRCHSEMNWRPVVSITRNDTIILPSLSIDSNGHYENSIQMPPCLPRIETSEVAEDDEDHEWPPPKQFLEGDEDDDGDEIDRNMLLQYLKKGARPSVTPMNSIDGDSTNADDVSEMDVPILEEPEIKGAFEVVHLMKKSTMKVQCKEVNSGRSRRPQVLKRVSIGDDLTLTFTKGTVPVIPANQQWNSRRGKGKAYVRASLPVLRGTSALARSGRGLGPKSKSQAYIRSPVTPTSPRLFNKDSPTDDEIIAMYRQGLLGATPRPTNSGLSVLSSNSNFPPSTIRPDSTENFDSNYSTPTMLSHPPTCEKKVPPQKETDKIDTIYSEPSTRSSSSMRHPESLSSGISRGELTSNSNGSDSRKPSDPNCLQLPNGASAIEFNEHKTEKHSSMPDQVDGPQVYWDSKSSTPALLDPPDMDSRPLSCASSLADASFMLENDDIASLPGSPFPFTKAGCHPRLARRSSSVDSGISRPGSDFLEVPLTSTVSSKDKLPLITDSPHESPIASPVSMLSDHSRYSEDNIQHQVVHRVSGGLSPVGSPENEANSEVPQQAVSVGLERKTSEGLVAPAVSLTTEEGDDYAVWFGRRGSIFIEEKGPQPPPQLQTTVDETGQVSLAIPKLPN